MFTQIKRKKPLLPSVSRHCCIFEEKGGKLHEAKVEVLSFEFASY
jgi:hypothetical protein